MKTNKDFETFQREFKKWQKLFGLVGYKVYFKYKSLNGYFASIGIDQGSMIATVSLNSMVHKDDKPHRNIKQSAKHEAIHLLVGRLEHNGRYRYSTESEISETTEELVFKLEELIS